MAASFIKPATSRDTPGRGVLCAAALIGREHRNDGAAPPVVAAGRCLAASAFGAGEEQSRDWWTDSDDVVRATRLPSLLPSRLLRRESGFNDP